MSVFLWREDTENIVVLMHSLTPVAALLLVGPVAVRIAELTLDGGWINVAAVLIDLLAVVFANDEGKIA
jgi:hypothetical protein